MGHQLQKRLHIGHPAGLGQLRKHGLVVSGIPEKQHGFVKILHTPYRLEKELRHGDLVIIPEPCVDVDGADLCYRPHGFGDVLNPPGGFKAQPGLVLGALAGVPYRSCELSLAPGDAIYLYTDGITEQPNASGELFGEARLLELLKAAPCCQKDLLDGVLASVAAYARAVEQADDCTQLAIRYRGVPTSVEHTYPPTMEGLAQATADLEAALADVPMKAQATLMVAADEIFANIVRHSGATDWTLKVEHQKFPDAVRLVFCDDGKPFDPLRQRDPDTTLDATERAIGGLGILIVKKTMSPVTYARRNGRNILTMGLTFEG